MGRMVSQQEGCGFDSCTGPFTVELRVNLPSPCCIITNKVLCLIFQFYYEQLRDEGAETEGLIITVNFIHFCGTSKLLITANVYIRRSRCCLICAPLCKMVHNITAQIVFVFRDTVEMKILHIQ